MWHITEQELEKIEKTREKWLQESKRCVIIKMSFKTIYLQKNLTVIGGSLAVSRITVGFAYNEKSREPQDAPSSCRFFDFIKEKKMADYIKIPKGYKLITEPRKMTKEEIVKHFGEYHASLDIIGYYDLIPNIKLVKVEDEDGR